MTTTPPGQPTPPSPRPPGDHIPLEPLGAKEPSAPARAPGPPATRESLLHSSLTACPGCGTALGEESVVCTKCGLDLRIGQRREVDVGEVEVPDTSPKPEFLLPGRVPPRVHVMIAGACAIGAAILAGVNAPRGNNAIVIGMVLKTMYDTIVHTGTGVVAIAAAAVLARARLTRYDLAASRMFLAFAIFQLVSQIRLPGVAWWVSGVLFFLAAGVMYVLALMALLKKSREQVFNIGALHAALWLLFEGGFQLAKWLGSEMEHLPRSG